MGSWPEAADPLPAPPGGRSGLTDRARPGHGALLRTDGGRHWRVRRQILGYLGLADAGWAAWLLELLALVLGLVSNWLVFLWVFARLPREPVTWRSAIFAAIGAAIGLEVIKRVMVVYLAAVTQTPAGLAFGPILGLLIFIFTVSQFLLFLTAWAATARRTRSATAAGALPRGDPAGGHGAQRPRAGCRHGSARRGRDSRPSRLPLARSPEAHRAARSSLDAGEPGHRLPTARTRINISCSGNRAGMRSPTLPSAEPGSVIPSAVHGGGRIPRMWAGRSPGGCSCTR